MTFSPEIRVKTLPRLMVRVNQPVLLFTGLFGGTAHALPARFYLGGVVGPFDIIVIALILRWFLCSSHRTYKGNLRLYAPFFVLTVFAYIGDTSGAFIFGGQSFSSVVAPARFILYPTLLFTLDHYLREQDHLKTLFVGYVVGVVLISLLAWFRSPDPGFFMGFPVLYDPNVVGNFIGYAFICLGFCCMHTKALVKQSMLAVLFFFAIFTFSKASWLLALIGLYLNGLFVSRITIILVSLVLTVVGFSLVEWGVVAKAVSDAIEMKIASSVGNGTTGGTAFMRLGFFLTSIYSLFDYPFGVGLKNFEALNRSYSQRLGELYFDSQSPHTAVGFFAVQAGWIGMALFAVIYYNVIKALFCLYGSPSTPVKLSLIAMVTVSVFFQIEFITQPFIYLVLAAAAAQARNIGNHTVCGVK